MSDTNQTHEGPRVSAGQMRDLDRLRRSRSDRYVAGVAGGLGRHFDVDPTIIRVAFVVLSFFGGAGLLLYGVGALLIPSDDRGRAAVDVATETRRILLFAALAIAFLLLVGGAWSGHGYFWPIGVIVAIGVVVLIGHDRHTRAPQVAPQTTPHDTGLQPSASTAAPPAAPSGAGTDPAAAYAGEHADGRPSGEPPAWWPPRPGGYKPPPPRPPRTGVIWFWPTLAMIAIGMGVLGVLDTNHAIPDGAYPALALAITGVMTLVGAFFGRPGGLIAIGVVSLLGLSTTSVLGDGFSAQEHNIDAVPTSATQLKSDYHTSTGRIDVDLTRLDDSTALNGRDIDVHVKVGQITVTVPRDVTVEVDAEVKFAGDIQVNDHDVDHGGLNPQVDEVLKGTDTSGPILHLDLDARVGQITVSQQ